MSFLFFFPVSIFFHLLLFFVSCFVFFFFFKQKTAYEMRISDWSSDVCSSDLAETAASADDLRDYLARLNRAGMAPTTTARRLSALRQFYRFLFAEGVRLDDPTGVIDSPRRGRTLPKVLSEEEVEKLRPTAERIEGPEGSRLAAMLELHYATGRRV